MTTACDVAEELLGPVGRMIATSKSRYRERFPDHAAVFNANVCLGSVKVWYGDLDLTNDEAPLVQLAHRLGGSVYVLFEPDGRFKHEAAPLVDQAVFQTTSCGRAIFDDRHFYRAADQSLRRKRRTNSQL
jgi:hypothetical protein